MRITNSSPRCTKQVILGSLLALILVASPAVAQHRGGGKGHTDHGNGKGLGHEKHHDRTNPKPPKPPKDKSSANSSVGRVSGAANAGAAIASVGQRMVLALQTGTLTTSAGRPIAPESQRALLSALSPNANGDGVALLMALTSNGNEQAKKPAKKLIEALPGAYETPDRLSVAVKAFNSLVDASSAEFLVNPPAEFLAIQAVLAPMAHEAFVVSAAQP